MSLFSLNPEELAAIESEVEASCVAAGTQCNIEITEIIPDKEGNVLRTNNSGFPYLMFRMKIVGTGRDQDFKEFTHYFGIPDDGMEPGKLKSARLMYKKFCSAFGIELTKKDLGERDFLGKRAKVELGLETDETYGDKNTIKTFL